MGINIGEIKQGKELGFQQSQQYERFIWLECPSCHTRRWVRLYLHHRAEEENRVLKCKECNGREQGRVNSQNWEKLDE